MRRLRFLLPVVLTPCAAFWACSAPVGPDLQVHSLTIPLEGPCPAGGGGAEFTQEVSALSATITAPDMTEVVTGTGDLSTGVTIEAVPAGVGRIVSLFGLAGGAPTWRGVSAPIEVKGGESTPVDILLAKVAALSCARGSSLEKRAFHTATLLDDGTVLVVGGAKKMVDASVTCETGCKEASATETAALYDPKTGAFTAVGRLATPRMFHTAVKMADGRVVIAGGAQGAKFHQPGVNNTFLFPIDPQQPVDTVEVYDPKTKAFGAGGTDPNGARIFAAATTLVTGEAIITGGIKRSGPAESPPVSNDLSNAVSTTTICTGTPLVCQNGPPMAAKRAGHIAFTLDPEGVFLWGGSVDTGVNGFQIEALSPNRPNFDLLQACEMNANRNVFFAAGALYSGFRMMSAGGLKRENDGTFHAVLDGNNEGSAVFVFDLAIAGDGCQTGVTAGPQPRMNLQGTRFFASAAGLPDQASALIVGGFEIPADFNDVDFTPVDTVERYVEDGLIIDNLAVGGVLPKLREPRGGATATAIGDGTVVIVGGRNLDDAVETAEVFADSKVPPQAAGFTQ